MKKSGRKNTLDTANQLHLIHPIHSLLLPQGLYPPPQTQLPHQASMIVVNPQLFGLRQDGHFPWGNLQQL